MKDDLQHELLRLERIIKELDTQIEDIKDNTNIRAHGRLVGAKSTTGKEPESKVRIRSSRR
jgi:hypothetical protein